MMDRIQQRILAEVADLHEVPEGAESFTYYGYERTGMAKIISNYATDLPRVDVKGEMKTGYVKSIGDSYGYNVQEMRASRTAGKSLDSRRADSARYHIDRLTNTLIWVGDKANKLVGILSDDNDIPVYTLTPGAKTNKTSWLEKDPDEIVEDVKSWLTQMELSTQGVEKADRLGIPSDVYIALSLRRIESTESSVLKYLQDNLPGIKIVACHELNSTSVDTQPLRQGAGSTTPGQGVGILYKYDADKMSAENPHALPPAPRPVQEPGGRDHVRGPCRRRCHLLPHVRHDYRGHLRRRKLKCCSRTTVRRSSTSAA